MAGWSSYVSGWRSGSIPLRTVSSGWSDATRAPGSGVSGTGAEGGRFTASTVNEKTALQALSEKPSVARARHQ